VSRARRLLVDELLGDFPFVDDASRANAMALLMTPIVRPMIDGNVPLALLDKPGAGTGASLLAEVISVIATGRMGAMMSAPHEDDEWRKEITSMLLDGATFILIDNVVGRLRAASLARALTGATWKDRILGKNVSVELPQRAIWLATGNNLRIGGDLARRSYWIRLDAKVARPYLREASGFRHLLPQWAIEQRGSLLAAALTLGVGWVAAGRPAVKTAAIGGFTPWAETVGGILAFAGIDGFLANASALYEQIDEEASAWDAFIAVWFSIFTDTPMRVAEVEMEVRREGSPLREALPGDLQSALDAKKFAASLGYALRARRDQVIGDFRLERVEEKHVKLARWRVRLAITRATAAKSSEESRGTGWPAGDAGDESRPPARARGDEPRPESSPPCPASPAAMHASASVADTHARGDDGAPTEQTAFTVDLATSRKSVLL
jgi:hypothetical protein